METFWEVVKDWTVLLLKVYGCLLLVQCLLYVGGSNMSLPYVAPVFLMLRDLFLHFKHSIVGYY